MNDNPNFHGYRVELYRDDDGWTAEAPELPGCVAAGDSTSEALEMLEDAIDAWLSAAAAKGRMIPAPNRLTIAISVAGFSSGFRRVCIAPWPPDPGEKASA
jgi:predicted RNase H-like HicB family nuclease